MANQLLLSSQDQAFSEGLFSWTDKTGFNGWSFLVNGPLGLEDVDSPEAKTELQGGQDVLQRGLQTHGLDSRGGPGLDSLRRQKNPPQASGTRPCRFVSPPSRLLVKITST